MQSLDAVPPPAPARAGPLRATLRELPADLGASARENGPLILCTLVYIATVNLIAMAAGVPHHSFDHLADNYLVFFDICFASLAVASIVWLLHLTLVRGIPIRSPEARRLLMTELLSRERLLQALPILLLWPLFAKAFSLMKSLVPLIQPFHMDRSLAELDRALHLGHDPWTLLQPLLGHPMATSLIDSFYALWFFLIYFAVLTQAVALDRRRLRMQFMLSFTLAWLILGCLAATLLSSAGPCYFGQIVGSPDPFAPLMSYLRDTAQSAQLSILGHEFSPQLIAVRVQDMLWTDYRQGDFEFGRGISAAPSMHVGSTWLVARLLQCYGRRAAIFGWSFFALILIGSVHLGWHYAIDGYIAAAGAWIIWRAVGWWLDRPAVQGFLWPQGLAAKAV
ncbi:MAG: phosphatase PAP2 family protein [Dongiaceae bacterium]